MRIVLSLPHSQVTPQSFCHQHSSTTPCRYSPKLLRKLVVSRRHSELSRALLARPCVRLSRSIVCASAEAGSSSPAKAAGASSRQHSAAPLVLKWQQCRSLFRSFILEADSWMTFMNEAFQLPGQLTYPTFKGLIWKGCLILIAIMVLMVTVSTIDSGFLYFVVKLMRSTA